MLKGLRTRGHRYGFWRVRVGVDPQIPAGLPVVLPTREECLHMQVAAEFAVRKGSLNLQIVNRRLPAALSDGVGKLTTLQEELEEAQRALQVAE